MPLQACFAPASAEVAAGAASVGAALVGIATGGAASGAGAAGATAAGAAVGGASLEQAPAKTPVMAAIKRALGFMGIQGRAATITRIGAAFDAPEQGISVAERAIEAGKGRAVALGRAAEHEMADAIVVGGGPGAVRAAGALARSGRSVVLLQVGTRVASLAHPDVPMGTGLERFVQAPPGWRPVPSLTTGVMVGRDCACVRALPLSRATLPGIFPALELPSALAAWSRSRAKVELARLIGGGQETRFYKDWVVQHFGVPVFERLFAPYCTRRFGDPAELTVNVARAIHAERPGGWYSRESGTAAELAGNLSGVQVVVDAKISALQAGKVVVEGGEFEGELYVDLPPARVVELLGPAAPHGLAHEVARLRCRHALEVVVQGGSSLPMVTHVVDAPMPFYRLVRLGALPGNPSLAGTVSVQFSLEEGDALWETPNEALVQQVVSALLSIGIDDASATGARVQRVANFHPVWAYTHHARMRQYAIRLAELKITPVGRSGLFAPVDGSAEAGFLNDLAAGGLSVRELFRRHVDPPVVDDDGSASLADFVLA